MPPKSTKNHSQEASKTLLKPTSCWKLFLLFFWLLFAPPDTSKMMVFPKGIIRFSKILSFLQRPQKSPKIIPKWSQHGLPDASGELKMRVQILAVFGVTFQIHVLHFRNHFGLQNRPQNRPKIDIGGQSPPRRFRTAFLEPFCTILPSFWDPRTFIFEHSSFHICCLFPLSAPACCLRGGRFRGRSPLLDPATEHSLKL